ncbi:MULTISPECIES: ABC transporter substrate-binding protein [unclassified Chryseobacterium]|uniref:ABC transporter substrate-binding protein n=1 Tax=unclassified Chryseobacterium TaxID=2593645 RepID=UPI000D37DB38|nr:MULTISPECIES: ABC transporter substrate-binding protein [unclassified Chryseobacterium]PTT72599.1 hypothetical protein DBR25_14350 [Chryseobacterium sp. HMWF001]PVV50420.1 hypothetical protein DD829_22410 [Chryseobacterium sp. HMWF035]
MVSKIIRNKTTKIIALIILLVLAGCDKKKEQSQNQLTKVSVRQEWFPFSGYAGEVMAINETAKKNGLEIKLNAGSDNIDPIKLVLSGEDDFGVVSADRIITANEQGADLVVIGVINPVSPTCFITKKESNIVSPQDFEGKKIGILTGTNTEYIYKALVSKLKLNRSRIQEVEIPFDLATFITGNYDVRPGFIYDEPVSLDEKNIQYNIIKPSDYDIHFLGTVYFTRRKLIQEKPQLVQSFVNAMAEGWGKAIKDPAKAIHYLKAYDSNIKEERELASLKKGLYYFQGKDHRVLIADDQEWQKMAQTLKELGVIKTFDLKKMVDMQFINHYYREK